MWLIEFRAAYTHGVQSPVPHNQDRKLGMAGRACNPDTLQEDTDRRPPLATGQA